MESMPQTALHGGAHFPYMSKIKLLNIFLFSEIGYKYRGDIQMELTPLTTL